MKDSEFKNLPHVFEPGYKEIKVQGKYNPDVIAVNDNFKKAIIIESSSTGDRKVNIGEMFQADMWLREKGYQGTLIIVLDGKGKYPPACKEQKERLLTLFNEYLKSSIIGLEKVVIVTQSEYTEVSFNVKNIIDSSLNIIIK